MSPAVDDYGLHAIKTTQDYSYRLPLILQLILFPFSDHRLHHLLPSVDESRLKELDSCLSETCQEFAVVNAVIDWHTLLVGMISKWLRSAGCAEWKEDRERVESYRKQKKRE